MLSSVSLKLGVSEIIQLPYGMEQANTYLLVDGTHTIVVDVCSIRVVGELHHYNLTPDYVILTHEHVDHLWGLNALRETFPDVRVIAQEECSKRIGSPKTNKAAEYRIYAVLRFGEEYKSKEADNKSYHCLPADIVFEKNMNLEWCGHILNLLHTPGHSPGSCIVMLNDIVFSGDTILNGETFLKFDGGNQQAYKSVTLSVIKSIHPIAKIMPGV